MNAQIYPFVIPLSSEVKTREQSGMRKVHRNSFLLGRKQQGSSEQVANDIHVCILLNSAAMQADVPVLVRLWDVFDLAICADGGANRLYDGLQALGPSMVSKCVPTFIKGDLDSLRPDVERFYRSSKCRVVRDPDQDTNDLEKCLQLVQDLCEGKQPTGDEDAAENADGVHCFPQLQNKQHSITVVVFGAFGGRFDQQIATLHALYLYADYFDRIVLLGDGNCATLLHPGARHDGTMRRQTEPKESLNAALSVLPSSSPSPAAVISETVEQSPNDMITHTLCLIPAVEGPSCSLLPVGSRCDMVSTTGLKWNLASQPLALGELISTSNRVVGNEGKASGDDDATTSVAATELDQESAITVQTSHPLLWCCKINLNNACIS